MKLTQTVKKGGCAAKVPALILREILDGVKFPPRIEGVTVDGTHFDDAAIFKVTDTHSLVQTLDFFTPIVDDPFDFGAVAAANALSDVYAMGGRPKTCMAILAAPLAVLEPSVIRDVLQGACERIAAAGASLVGGHSIDDDTLKFGLSVTGLVQNERIWSNEGAKVGDVVILTKPLGTGTLCAGIKRGELKEDHAQEAIASMKRLNNVIDFLSEEELLAIHGGTDVTGFGLAGHSCQMAKASGVTLRLQSSMLPLFAGTKSAIESGWLTKAHRSNEEYTRTRLHFGDVTETNRLITFDPQTSGGLLLSVSPALAEMMVKKLSPHFPGTAIIGEVIPRREFDVVME